MITAALIQAILASGSADIVGDDLLDSETPTMASERTMVTPMNDHLVDGENPNLEVPKSELDPPPHKAPGDGLPDQTLRLKEDGVGTINQSDIIV